MSKNPNKWDGIIAAILKDKSEDISGLFDVVFSHLERKTLFFQNFVQSKLDEYLAKHHQGEAALVERQQKRKDELADRQRAKEEKQGLKEELREIMEKIEQKKKENEEKEAESKRKRKEKAAQEKKEKAEKEGNTMEQTEEKEEKEDEVPEYEKDRGDLPYKCGGVTEKYIWNQTLVELMVTIPLPKEVKSDDLNVEISNVKLHISIKGKETEPILDGEWYDQICPSDCLWTVETYEGTGKTLNLTIQKFPEFQGWWESIVKGEPKIDIGKVQPEDNSLQHLDSDVQREVQKALYDQRQRQMGLPTIEEMENQKKMEEIFKKNPNLRSQFGGVPPKMAGGMGKGPK